jgi:hypothetical protein
MFDQFWQLKINYNMLQLLADGRLFSSGTPASSSTKTGRHDIVQILLKVTLSTQNRM